jgi:hypothetical protein
MLEDLKKSTQKRQKSAKAGLAQLVEHLICNIINQHKSAVFYLKSLPTL